MSFPPFAICTVVMLFAIPAIAQTTLKIPRDAREMQEIMRQSEGSCSNCGVVTSVVSVEAGGMQNPLVAEASPGDPGPGTDIQTSPVFGSASKSYSAKNPDPGRWRIIVRYDDGCPRRLNFEQAYRLNFDQVR